MSSIQALQSSTTTFDPSDPDDPMSATVDAGDIGAEVAALAIKNGNSERTSAHEQRGLDEAEQQNADNEQVQDMRDEASSMRTQAWVDGGIGLVGAAASVVVPMVAAGPAATGAAASTGATAADWGAASTAGTTAAGKMVDGFFSAAQHGDEANAAQDKAAADRFASDASDAATAAGDANATVSNALDFARSYVTTEASTQAAALHRA
jgi:hypothetical protein